MSYPKKDWTGRKYNYLTFVRRSDRKSGSTTKWELRCDCGNIVYKLAHIVVNGSIQSCGCKQSEARSRSGMKARKYDPVISSARRVWRNTYKDDGLDFDTFYALSQQPCHYCGRPPHRITNAAASARTASATQLHDGYFTYNGLDRVDNTKGHTRGNLVPCCSTCNYMKRNMTLSEFLEQVGRIFWYHADRYPFKIVVSCAEGVARWAFGLKVIERRGKK